MFIAPSTAQGHSSQGFLFTNTSKSNTSLGSIYIQTYLHNNKTKNKEERKKGRKKKMKEERKKERKKE